MKLTELKLKGKAVVVDITAKKGLTKQILALGVEVGDELELKYQAPFAGPLCIRTNDKLIVIRREEANQILVEPLQNISTVEK